MITFTQDEINKTPKEVQQWYKQNLGGTSVVHPLIGEIRIYNKQFGETRNKIPTKYLPILYKLPQIIQTSNTNGKIAPDTGKHADIKNLKGFCYLYNKIQYNNELLDLKLDIMVLNNEQKYYMFTFSINENQKPDSIMFTDVNLSGRGMVLNYIVTHINENVKPDPENPKIGDVFWLGDSMRIEIVDIKQPEQTKIQKLNKQLKEILGD